MLTGIDRGAASRGVPPRSTPRSPACTCTAGPRRRGADVPDLVASDLVAARPVRCWSCATERDPRRRRRDRGLPTGLGRDRPRRGARQRARRCASCVAPAALLAVVKADGYGHGAVPVARAALEAGATGLGVALVEEGVELRDAGHRRADPRAVRAGARRGADASSRTRSRRSSTRWPGSTRSRRRSPIAARASRSPCTSRSTPACTASGAAPTRRSTLAAQVVDRPELRARGRVHAPRGRRRARQPVHRRAARARSTRCSATLRARGLSDRHRARRATPPARSTWPARALRPRAGRASASTASRRRRRARRPRRAAAGDVGEGARVAREGRCRAGERVSYGLRYETVAPTRSRPCRSATPTACRASSPQRGGEVLVRGRRCPIAGTVTMDQLMVDVGDLPVEVGDEVVLHRPAGRRGDHGGGVGASAMGTIAYDDRVRHRAACAADGTRRMSIGEASRKVAGIARRRRRCGRRRGVRGQRAARRRGCARSPTATPRGSLDAPIYVDRRLDAHDGGIDLRRREGRRGPPIVLSHGVTLLGAHVVPPARGRCRRRASARSRSTTGATAQSMLGDAGHSRREPRASTCRPCSRSSTCATWCSSATRWAASRCRRSSRIPRDRGRACRRHRACSRRSPRRRSARTRRGTRRADRAAHEPHARHDAGCGSTPNLGFLAGAARVRARTRSPSHVELRARRCWPSARPRPRCARAARWSASTSPRLPNVDDADARRSAARPTCSRRPRDARRIAAAHPRRPARAVRPAAGTC